MKIVVLALFVALAAAAPQELEKRPLEILRDERVVPVNGVYSFQVETENGIVHTEEGAVGSKGQTNVQGSYSYVLDDGSIAEVRYTADENGFQPESLLLPVAPAFPHPIPQYVLDQIAFGEEQRRLAAIAEQEEAQLEQVLQQQQQLQQEVQLQRVAVQQQQQLVQQQQQQQLVQLQVEQEASQTVAQEEEEEKEE
ncbi:cuticle protein AMP4-like [Panulirus ornatus]|uniref:cuticle protein AMP4-like n=1 Tax=Panulirus ornatus TaxID=150431 RepID=UPI003A87D0FD